MNVLAVAGAIVLGWLAGYIANWAADVLPQRPEKEGAGLSERWPQRPLLLNVALAVAFAVTAFLFAPDPIRVAIGCLYAAFLLTVLVIDFEHRRVLNIMLAPAAVIALALSLLPQTPPDLANALVGGGVGLGLFVLVYLLSRGHLGMGDVKLAGVIGLMLGYPGVVNALMVGILMGAAAAIFLLVTRRATRKSYMAYAPYLALGTLFVLWWTW
jgi:leader peptidase (prepilin peptidase)/N-methyltransferase